jgi:Aspartate-semialdehyde dehydrogenase
MIRNVAIMGATGAVGQEILSILEERNFPLQSLKLLASERSAGKEFKFKGETLKCEVLNKDSFKGIDLVLSSAGAAISQEFAPIAVENGAVVVDNTSFFRMDPKVPLVVPEVNPEDIKLYKAELGGKGIIANPNCTTIMMVVVLNPIEKISHIKKIHISSYQSASGAGAIAMEELKQQYKDILETGSTTHINKFPFQLAYNVIPQIDKMTEKRLHQGRDEDVQRDAQDYALRRPHECHLRARELAAFPLRIRVVRNRTSGFCRRNPQRSQERPGRDPQGRPAELRLPDAA